MYKRTAIVIAGLMTIFCLSVKAQQGAGILDIITLNDDNGVLKGYISELAPGHSVTIVPQKATLKIAWDKMTEASKKNDTDVLTLKNGIRLEGKIVEQAPGKWTRIQTGETAPLTYPYAEISKIGKETENPNSDLFEACGILDVLTLKNNQVVKGVITEQLVGENVKIRTTDNEVFIYPLRDIIAVERDAYNPSKPLFFQSAHIDVVKLKDGTTLRGIIVTQTPGEDIKLEFKDEQPVSMKYADVVKIFKEANPWRGDKSAFVEVEPDEETNDIATAESDETNSIISEPGQTGDCFWLLEDQILIPLEKQSYTNGKRTPTLWLLDGGQKSGVILPLRKEIRLVVRTIDNRAPATDYIRIFKTDYNKGVKRRCINSTRYPFLSQTTAANTKPPLIAYEYNRIGNYSFEIIFRIETAGEYAVHVEGSNNVFSLFGAKK